MYEDAAFIAKHIARLADAGKDILVIAHSYGGTPATESIKGLSKKERVERGKKGGVVGLAYMTSLVPELGHPASTSTLSPLMEVGVRYPSFLKPVSRTDTGRMMAGCTTLISPW
jgi:hypothetical protein